jgi:hypothetical protein
MRKFCLILACLFSGALAAETIGNVEFEFPPSTYNWVLLTDTSAYSSPEPIAVKMYTHKVGNNLEFFSATAMFDTEAEMVEEEYQDAEPFHTSEFAQLFINDLFGGYFPNHRISITNLSETNDAGLLEWEMSDGVQVIFHGICRYMRVDQKDVILSYATIASRTAENSALWIDVLNRAKPID